MNTWIKKLNKNVSLAFTHSYGLLLHFMKMRTNYYKKCFLVTELKLFVLFSKYSDICISIQVAMITCC